MDKQDIACVIMEPVMGNVGVVPPQKGFLEDLRKVTEEHGTILIFDVADFESTGHCVPSHDINVATAIKIGNPVSWPKSMRAVTWSNGVVEQVTEQEIMDAKAKLDAAGIGAEPASCCSLAGAKKLRDSGVIGPDEKVVGILTGNILKDPDAVVGYHQDTLMDHYGIRGTFANKPVVIPATLDAVRKALGD